MLNIEYKIDDKTKKMTIVVDLSQRHGLSSSGNTITIASTQGNQKIGLGDIAVGLSVYTKEGLPKAQADAAKAAGYNNWAEFQKATKA